MLGGKRCTLPRQIVRSGDAHDGSPRENCPPGDTLGIGSACPFRCSWQASSSPCPDYAAQTPNRATRTSGNGGRSPATTAPRNCPRSGAELDPERPARPFTRAEQFHIGLAGSRLMAFRGGHMLPADRTGQVPRADHRLPARVRTRSSRHWAGRRSASEGRTRLHASALVGDADRPLPPTSGRRPHHAMSRRAAR